MTIFDHTLLGILAISLLLGMWRGVVGELMSLAAWAVGFFAAKTLAADTASVFEGFIAVPVLRYAGGFALVFIGTLIVFGIARRLFSKLLNAAGLGLSDRFLGALFGAGRAGLIAFVLVLVGGMTAFPKEVWWRDATLAPPLETLVISSKPWLPPDVAKRISYR